MFELQMALKDQIPFGMSLPHRSPEPIAMPAVLGVAGRAETLGFSDLWVTENTIDHAFSFEPMVALAYAAAVTSRIRLGVSVIVLPLRSPIHVAHAVASLDYVSGGRAILGVGLGREHYGDFQVPRQRRVRRFLEQIELIRTLWGQAPVDHEGQIYQFKGSITLKPVQQPHPPIWMGGTHPEALRRAATFADGWMGAGGQSTTSFGESVMLLRAALEKAGRDPSTYPISKRVFMSVHEEAAIARSEVNRWFTDVYHNPTQTDTNGVHGTPEQVREQIEALVAMGANHLLLNPVARYEEQVEALASVVGLV
jgi:probable F420-dependent oxidoreductase